MGIVGVEDETLPEGVRNETISVDRSDALHGFLNCFFSAAVIIRCFQCAKGEVHPLITIDTARNRNCHEVKKSQSS